MGRTANQIPAPASAVGQLAQYLRNGLLRRGLNYREIADDTKYHPTTLQRAADGRTVASWAVVNVFARKCGLDQDEALRLWQAARSERTGRPVPPRTPPVGVEQIASYADLALYLEWIRERAGVTYRQIARSTQENGRFRPLPSSTAQRIGARKSRPSMAQMQAFLLGCSVPSDQHGPFVRAWQRAEALYWEGQAVDDRARRATQSAEPEQRPEEESPQQMAYDLGYLPMEPYRSSTKPWSVRCQRCGNTLRIRLMRALQHHNRPDGTTYMGCGQCRTLDETIGSEFINGDGR